MAAYRQCLDHDHDHEALNYNISMKVNTKKVQFRVKGNASTIYAQLAEKGHNVERSGMENQREQSG